MGLEEKLPSGFLLSTVCQLWATRASFLPPCAFPISRAVGLLIRTYRRPSPT